MAATRTVMQINRQTLRSLRKRATVLAYDWLGVLIAGVIVVLTGIFGGTYLYARGHIDSTLSWVTQSINLMVPPGLSLNETVDSSGASYHLTLQLANPSEEKASVSISDVEVKLGDYAFIVAPDGAWDKTAPSGYTYFEGDIYIDSATFKSIASMGAVEVSVSGNISASAHYLWVTRHSELAFQRTTTAEFQ